MSASHIVWFCCCLVLTAEFAVLGHNVRADETDTSQQISLLVKQLDSDDPEQRAEAIANLAKSGPEATSALPRLVELLGDLQLAKIENRSIQIRSHVIESFKKMRPLIHKPLLAGLASNDRQVRIGVVTAFRELRHVAAVDVLIELLNDEDREVAYTAATALTQIGQPAITRLIAAMSDQSVQARYRAVATLGNIRDPRVVKPVARQLYDADKTVRAFAVNALSNLAFHHPRGTVWRSADETQDSPAAELVRAKTDSVLKDLVMAELVDALQSGNTRAQLAAADCAFFRSDSSLIEPLAACLVSDDPALRVKVIRALAGIRHADILEHIGVGLDDRDADVRTAYLNSKNQKHREHAITKLYPEQAMRFVQDALTDEDPKVRMYAMKADTVE